MAFALPRLQDPAIRKAARSKPLTLSLRDKKPKTAQLLKAAGRALRSDNPGAWVAIRRNQAGDVTIEKLQLGDDVVAVAHVASGTRPPRLAGLSSLPAGRYQLHPRQGGSWFHVKPLEPTASPVPSPEPPKPAVLRPTPGLCGTRYGYQHGCRCGMCRAAEAEYKRIWRERIRAS